MFRFSRETVTRGIVLQITALYDREFSITKQKSNSIQEPKTHGLHHTSKSDLLTKMFELSLICMDTKEKEL